LLVKTQLQAFFTLYADVLYRQKGKAMPLDTLPNPKVSRILRIPDFKKIGT